MTAPRPALAALILILAASRPAWPAAEGVDFTLPDVDGVPHSLSGFRGGWVAVNFWASWCGPCVAEIPALNALHRHPALTVIGINFEWLTPQALSDFIAETGIAYPVLRIGEQPLVPFEPLRGIPTTCLVAPDGRLAGCRPGPVSPAWLTETTGIPLAADAPQ